MPVPSTISGLRLTIVLMPYGRVASAQPFIMIGGPMAMHSSMSGWRSTAMRIPSATVPFTPRDPSSVHTITSSHTERNLSSQNTRSLLRNPMTPMT